MKIIVVDNNWSEANRLIDLLHEAYTDFEVFPEQKLTFPDWTQATSYVESFPDEVAILCLDLSLEDRDEADASRGVQRGADIRRLKPQWILLAYTRFGTFAARQHEYLDSFDGIVEKGDLIAISERHKRLGHVKQAIQGAIRKRTQRERGDILPGIRLIDSFGMRTFRAAFSDVAIAEIVENEASDWENISLEALTTGHSGAFMVAINGRVSGNPGSLVLKVARTPDTIANEIRALNKYMNQLQILGPYLVHLDDQPRELTDGQGVYYRQIKIEGTPLLETIRHTSWQRSRDTLDSIVQLCVGTFQSVNLKEPPVVPVREAFRLNPIDIGRLEASATFIAEFGATLRKHKLWPRSGKPSRVASEVVELARDWDMRICGESRTWAVMQHGDLNPGNVLIRSDGAPILIDLSRLGPWPIGYDLSRLALMLRLRLIGSAGHQDWLPDYLKQWYDHSVAFVDLDIDPKSSLCPPGAYCDQQFRNFVLKAPTEHQPLLTRVYKIGTMWDLIKVVSYQDVSPYKKIWSLLECWRLGRALTAEAG